MLIEVRLTHVINAFWLIFVMVRGSKTDSSLQAKKAPEGNSSDASTEKWNGPLPDALPFL
jgi:hypothetical protein